MGRKVTAANLLATLNEAIRLHNGGRWDEADALYRDVLRAAPRHPDALHLRALIAHAKGAFAEAASRADAAIAAAPRVANFHNTSGDAWRRVGDLQRAGERLATAIRLDPSLATAHHNLSAVRSAEGRNEEAIALNRRALELDPRNAPALAFGLELAAGAGDWTRATALAAQVERIADRALAASALSTYQCQLARHRFRQQEFAAGDTAAAAAIAADPQNWGGWALRGEAAYERLAFAEAELHCTIAANLAPWNPEAQRNLGLILKNTRRLDEAASHFAAVLARDGNDAQARFNLATIELMRGNYATGWKDYEARGSLPGARARAPGGVPLWDGRAVASLLVHAEQGLGDIVQMLRYVPQIAGRAGGRVILEVPAPLRRLVERTFGSARVDVVTEVPATTFEAACGWMSVPLALDVDRPERVRVRAPYLSADEPAVARFRERLARSPGRKLGIVWRGSDGSTANRLRRLPEEALAPIVSMPGWTAVSLQFGVRDPRLAGRPLVDVSDAIADFEDLAAAMAAVDAVVSLDTGPLHLAGALGVPVHALLPWLHDWRWGAGGDRCDWYPDMPLYRQSVGGSWAAPIARLVDVLGGRSSAAATADEAHDAPTAPTRGPIVANHHPFVHAVCRHGTFRLPLYDRYVTRSMLAYGEYSPEEAELLATCLRPGDTAVDVGANLGTLTLAMARAVGPTGSVVALEPQSMLHACLLETLAASAVTWVDARRQAAGAARGSARIPVGDPTRPGNYGGVALASGKDGEPVEVVRLDDLGLRSCRLIKIDVEGREADVLAGATATIDRFRPVLVVECDRPGSHERIDAFLRRYGYAIHAHEPRLFAPRNHRGCAVDLFPGIVSGNRVGLPPGVAPPAGLRAV